MIVILADDPHVHWEGEVMEFRLTYEGILLAESVRSAEVRRARAEHKQEIRKKLHPQLKRLWEISPFLSTVTGPKDGRRVFGRLSQEQGVEALAVRFERFGYHFVPLVTRELELFCSIEVLFLRRGDPGGIISATGDIDNRLKTLFDALTVPRDALQLGPYKNPDPDESPFFCLLEDDSLITKASVETDTLLGAVSDPPSPNDVRVVITVRIKPARINADNIGFA